MLVNSKKAAQNFLADIEGNQPGAFISKDWLNNNNQYNGIPPNNVLEALRLFLLQVYEDNNCKPLDQTIAKLAGFAPHPAPNEPVTADLNIEKLTYYVVFRFCFYNGHNSLFENWLESANQLRKLNYLNFQTNTQPFYPTPGSNQAYCPKRLHHNGEEEASPITANEPIAKIYNQETDYHFFEIVVDYLLKEQGYFLGVIPPVEYYLLGEHETPYFAEWIRKERSKPFIPGPPNNPEIIANYHTITINVQGLIIDDYYLERDNQKDEKILPRIISIIDSNLNIVEVIFYKKETFKVYSPQFSEYNIDPRDVEVDIRRDSTTNELFIRFKEKNIYLYFDEGFNSKLKLNYFEGEDIASKFDRGVCKIYYSIIKQAIIQIPSGTSLEIDDLIGLPIEKAGSGLIIKMPKNDVKVGGSGTSGITIDHGVDLGNGLVNLPSETGVKLANETWLNDFLSNTTTVWNNMSGADKDIVSHAMNIKGNAARVYWVKHKKLFGSLNFEDNRRASDSPPSTRNWKTVLCHVINYYEDRYYGAFKGQLTSDSNNNPYHSFTPSRIELDYSGMLLRRTVKRQRVPLIMTTPNVIEKFILVSLGINPNSGGAFSSNREKSLIKAINMHSMKELLKYLQSLSKGFSADKVKDTLLMSNNSEFKPQYVDYYNIFHYCNEFDNL